MFAFYTRFLFFKGNHELVSSHMAFVLPKCKRKVSCVCKYKNWHLKHCSWELQGEVAVNRRIDTRSYTNLHALVNGMFPATTSSEPVYISRNLICLFHQKKMFMVRILMNIYKQEDFNTWNFWKLPPPSFT